MTDQLAEPAALSLYELLSCGASAGTPVGETSITHAKETIDNDTEDVSDDVML